MNRILPLFATISFAASAQIVDVVSVTAVPLPQGVTADRAVLAPQGDFVVAASLSDMGLNRISTADAAVSRVADNGSTLDLQISDDGSTVVFRRQSFDRNHLRYVSVIGKNLISGEEVELAAPSRNLQGMSLADGMLRMVDSGKMKARALGATKSSSRSVASIDRGAMYITADGVTRCVCPQGVDGNSYLWPSVSPDGTKIAYYLAQVGAFVCDINGQNPVFLGEMRAPRWYGNDAIIGMDDRDDGRFVISSSIIMATADGRLHQRLTDESVRAMYPSASSDLNRIAFTTPDGALYIINVEPSATSAK